MSTFCPLIPASLLPWLLAREVLGSHAAAGWSGHRLPRPLLGTSASSGVFVLPTLPFPWLGPASPPDAQIPRQLSPRQSEQSSPFPGPGSLRRDTVATLGGPAVPSLQQPCTFSSPFSEAIN